MFLRAGRLTCALAVALSMLLPATADAAFPGANGTIAFSRAGDIYTVLPDGSGLAPVEARTSSEQRNFYPAWSPDGRRLVAAGELLHEDHGFPGSFHWSDMDLHLFGPDGWGFKRLETPHQHFSTMPAWSPDGSRIAYVSDEFVGNAIHLVRADGTDVLRLVEGREDETGMDPAWSPDGARIVFTRPSGAETAELDLFTMRPDGTDVRRLLELAGSESEPSWSPDGSSIAFAWGTGAESNIYMVSAEGGEPQQLTHGGSDLSPAWAPDGSAIVFASNRDADSGTSRQDLYLVNAEGGGERRLTTIGCWQCNPDWQPLSAGTSQPPTQGSPDQPGPPGPVTSVEVVYLGVRSGRGSEEFRPPRAPDSSVDLLVD